MPRTKSTGLEMYIAIAKAYVITSDKLVERFPEAEDLVNQIKDTVRGQMKETITKSLEETL